VIFLYLYVQIVSTNKQGPGLQAEPYKGEK
jgi:hypothetical protein